MRVVERLVACAGVALALGACGSSRHVVVNGRPYTVVVHGPLNASQASALSRSGGASTSDSGGVDSQPSDACGYVPIKDAQAAESKKLGPPRATTDGPVAASGLSIVRGLGCSYPTVGDDGLQFSTTEAASGEDAHALYEAFTAPYLRSDDENATATTLAVGDESMEVTGTAHRGAFSGPQFFLLARFATRVVFTECTFGTTEKACRAVFRDMVRVRTPGG